MFIVFSKHATFRRSISSQSAFYIFKTNILLPPWPIASKNKNPALSSRAQRILQQTTATAFSWGRLPVGRRVFVQNAISKHWDQQATVKAIRDDVKSYIIALDNGKQCIGRRILLRPVKSIIPTAQSTPHIPSTSTPLRRSARLQNKEANPSC